MAAFNFLPPRFDERIGLAFGQSPYSSDIHSLLEDSTKIDQSHSR